MADRFSELGLFLVTLAGWALLLYVIIGLPVSPSAQAVFYGASAVAIAGTAALTSALYQARAHGPESRPRAVAMLGGGIRLAVAAELALWLQSLRLLTPMYLVFIAAGFLLLEFVIRAAGGERRGSRE